jgi:hypothetical protein
MAGMREPGATIRHACFAFLLATLVVGCGNLELFIYLQFGTVLRDADCGPQGGSFDFRPEGGLTVLVIVTDDTDIVLASGLSGNCSDIRAGASAEVEGTEDAGTVEAMRVRIAS